VVVVTLIVEEETVEAVMVVEDVEINMNEYKDGFVHALLAQQSTLVDKFRRDFPKASQAEITAYALGLIHMGDFATKQYEKQ
jgi:hypothetical protein